MCWTTSPLLVLAEMPNVSQIPPSALSSRGRSQIPPTEPVAILAWSGLQLVREHTVEGSDASEAGALGQTYWASLRLTYIITTRRITSGDESK